MKPHSLTSETHVTDYHLFREGISPTWEDAKNRNGGKWIVRLRKVEGLASLYWEDLIMALVGEQFGDVGCQVCGVVVSVRQHEDILSVWTQDSKDDDAIAKIRDAIKTNLDLPIFVTRLQAPRLPRWSRKGLGAASATKDTATGRTVVTATTGARASTTATTPPAPPPAERDWGARAARHPACAAGPGDSAHHYYDFPPSRRMASGTTTSTSGSGTRRVSTAWGWCRSHPDAIAATVRLGLRYCLFLSSKAAAVLIFV